MKLAAQQIADYQRDGVICLRGVFEAHWLESLARGVERNFIDPGPYHTVYTDDGKPGGFYDDYCNWQRIDEYCDYINHSAAAALAGQLMQSSQVRIYHEHVLVKEPGTRESTPWHHDLPYYGVDGDQLCSIWMPLDSVPRSACPEFVVGSHSNGQLYYPRLFLTNENYAHGIDGFESLPDIESQREQLPIVSWDLQPGDCIVFHMRTLHGAPATARLTTRRRGFSTRWLGDDARFAQRAWKTSPPFPGLDLQPGEAMQHSCFPVVWQQ